jgi:N-methylhydantoinase A
MPIDPSLAEAAIASRIAEPLGVDLAEAAAGILRISNQNMAAALRLVSVERGFDPREFSLIAFGGAGPLHAAELARDVGVPEVIVPPLPGITSAVGLLFADLVQDVSRTVDLSYAAVDLAALEQVFQQLEADARRRVGRERDDKGVINATRLIDFRYEGQARTITIPLAVNGGLSGAELSAALEAFHVAHEREFGYARRGFGVELAVLRVSARAEITSPDVSVFGGASDEIDASLVAARRQVYFAEACWVETAIYKRPTLPSGATFKGPAILEAMDSTVVVPPDCTARIDERGNVIIHV